MRMHPSPAIPCSPLYHNVHVNTDLISVQFPLRIKKNSSDFSKLILLYKRNAKKSGINSSILRYPKCQRGRVPHRPSADTLPVLFLSFPTKTMKKYIKRNPFMPSTRIRLLVWEREQRSLFIQITILSLIHGDILLRRRSSFNDHFSSVWSSYST